jgi:ribulose 1,5-bisphosphate carboxylase large subunit-like protein
MTIDIVQNQKDLDKYFYVKYEITSATTVFDAAYDLAVGQSIGNPKQRSVWETEQMIEDYCCKIVKCEDLQKKSGTVEIAFPNANMDWEGDGVAQILCMIMGGQVDIDRILRCRAVSIEINDTIKSKYFRKPTYGLSGMRQRTGQYNKPLFGGIIKPKTGITPDQLLDMTKQLVDGGVDFIKEDEIMSNPAICPLHKRVEIVSKFIQTTNVVYCFCINADPGQLENRAQFVANNGGRGIHVNVWSGLGSYKTIRDLNLPLYIHYQKSGDKVFTHKDNPYSISWQLCCQLATLCGVDTIHSGMWGGYLSDPEEELRETLKILVDGNVVPALSCGMTAELIQPIYDKFGSDWMANVGGAIHSDPNGSTAGARKIRAAIDSIR